MGKTVLLASVHGRSAAKVAAFVLSLAAVIAAPGSPAASAAVPRTAAAHATGSRTTVSRAIVASDWPAYLYGPAHNSDAATETAITPATVATLHQQWQRVGSFLASPIVVGGAIYVGSMYGWFYKLDAATGTVLAKHFFGKVPPLTCDGMGIASTAAVGTDPVTHLDYVYVAAPDGYLYALRPADLSVKWRSVIAVPSSKVNDFYQWSSPTVAGGRIFVGISSNCDRPLIRGGVAGYIQSTGHRFATFYTVPKGKVGGSVWTSVAVDSTGYVYASTGNPKEGGPVYYGESIVKLDPATLRLVKIFTLTRAVAGPDSDFGGSPSIFGPYVGACDHNGIFYAVRRSTMTLAWSRRIGARVGGPVSVQCAAAAVYDGTHIYLAGPATTINGKTYRGSIDMLDPATGKFVWQTGLSNGVTGTPSLDGAGVLVVGSYDISATPNAIYAVSAATGKILRTLDQGSYDFAQSAFSGGLLVMANLTGLYCWHD